MTFVLLGRETNWFDIVRENCCLRAVVHDSCVSIEPFNPDWSTKTLAIRFSVKARLELLEATRRSNRGRARIEINGSSIGGNGRFGAISVRLCAFRMTKPNGKGDGNGDNRNGAYVNHALSGSGDSFNLGHSNSSQILRDSYDSHQGIQGSSDFICKYLLMENPLSSAKDLYHAERTCGDLQRL